MVASFKLLGADVAEDGVTALAVVEGFDVLEDGQPRPLARRPRRPIHQLLLEGGEEALGEDLAKLERCDVCGQTKGAVRRFRAALASVPAAERLPEWLPPKRGVYAGRSKTAHASELFGAETTFGVAPLGPAFKSHERDVFSTSTVRVLREANRTALIARVAAPSSPAPDPPWALAIDRPVRLRAQLRGSVEHPTQPRGTTALPDASPPTSSCRLPTPRGQSAWIGQWRE